MTELTELAKSSEWESLEYSQNLIQVQCYFSQPFLAKSYRTRCYYYHNNCHLHFLLLSH